MYYPSPSQAAEYERKTGIRTFTKAQVEGKAHRRIGSSSVICITEDKKREAELYAKTNNVSIAEALDKLC